MDCSKNMWVRGVCVAAMLTMGCGEAVGDTERPSETIAVQTFDTKSDSLLTHELDMTIEETDRIDVDGWGPVDPQTGRRDAESGVEWRSRIAVTSHGDETVSMRGTELIFRPPSYQRGEDPGWVMYLSGGSGDTFGFGTEMAMLVWSRSAGSDDEWRPVEFSEEGNGRFLSVFYNKPGVQKAWVNDTPTSRCKVTFGRLSGGDHSRYFSTNTTTRLPELDADQEYRIWVVPSYNFCEWSDRDYEVSVILEPLGIRWFEGKWLD